MGKERRLLYAVPIHTRDGEFTAWYSGSGLTRLTFPKATHKVTKGSKRLPAHTRAWHRVTRRALRKALAGCPAGTLPPIDLSQGTEFQQSVWRVLEQIVPGQTMSYADVAAAIGKPGAARAVGQACGANPVPVLVPCHRVLASNSKLGGFAGGTHWKRRLLAAEGVKL